MPLPAGLPQNSPTNEGCYASSQANQHLSTSVKHHTLSPPLYLWVPLGLCGGGEGRNVHFYPHRRLAIHSTAFGDMLFGVEAPMESLPMTAQTVKERSFSSVCTPSCSFFRHKGDCDLCPRLPCGAADRGIRSSYEGSHQCRTFRSFPRNQGTCV